MLHIPPTSLRLLAAKQESYKNIEEFSGKSSREWTSRQKKKEDKTERVIGLGRRTREEIVKWNQMTALRFQKGGGWGRHQTSPISLRGPRSWRPLRLPAPRRRAVLRPCLSGQLHVPRTCVQLSSSIFLYACESWTLTAELQRRIQAMEMRCYRKIQHIWYKDHVTNEEVRAKILQAVGPHAVLLTIVKRCKLQWCGHISRSSGLAKTILQDSENRRSEIPVRPDERETWPYHCSLRLFAIVRSSCGPVACWTLARTS